MAIFRGNERCPRCKSMTLNVRDCGESSLYGADHLICMPCFRNEEQQIIDAGTNDLPLTLETYGPSNTWLDARC